MNMAAYYQQMIAATRSQVIEPPAPRPGKQTAKAALHLDPVKKKGKRNALG